MNDLIHQAILRENTAQIGKLHDALNHFHQDVIALKETQTAMSANSLALQNLRDTANKVLSAISGMAEVNRLLVEEKLILARLSFIGLSLEHICCGIALAVILVICELAWIIAKH